MKKHQRIIDICLQMAARNIRQGSLFVLDMRQDAAGSYYQGAHPRLFNAGRELLSILQPAECETVAHLATLDGACIIDAKGCLVDYGVTLKRQSTFANHGKRHAFAKGTSRLQGIICILASEEDSHIRTFREGVCIADIDSATKMPPSVKDKLLDILDTPLSKLLVASGIAVSILTLNPIPAIITITGSSVAVSYGFDRIKKWFK